MVSLETKISQGNTAAYLLHRHTPRQQLDQVARLENCRGIKGFPRSLDHHASLDQIEGARNPLLLQGSRNNWPCLFQVYFSVFREQSHKGRLLREAAARIIVGLERLDLRELDRIHVERKPKH